MASKFAKARKRLVKAVQPALQSAGKVVSYTAPIAGGLLFGAPGAAVGTALGTGVRAATTKGDSAKKKSAAIKAAKIGAAVTAATGLVGLVSGAGIGAPAVSSFGRILGIGSSTPAPQIPGSVPATTADKVWDPVRGEFVSAGSSTPTQGSGDLGSAAAAVAGAYARQLGDGKEVPSGTSGVNTPAAFYDPATGAIGADLAGPPKEGMSPLLLVGLVGGGLLLLGRSKK